MKHYSEISSCLQSYKRVKLCIHHHSLHFPASMHTHQHLFFGVYHLSFSFTPSFWKRNLGQFHCTINTALKQLIDLSFLTHTWASSSDEYETFTGKPYEFHIFPCTFHPTRDMMSLCCVKDTCFTITVQSHQIYSKNHIFIRNIKM